jgi:hypothetical protein
MHIIYLQRHRSGPETGGGGSLVNRTDGWEGKSKERTEIGMHSFRTGPVGE